MEKYFTQQANDEFAKMEDIIRKKRGLSRMLTFVDMKISQCGDNIPRKLIEKRGHCLIKYLQANFERDKVSYRIDKLSENKQLLKN